MVAAGRDRWQAGAVQSLTRVATLLALAGLGGPAPIAPLPWPAGPALAQAPAGEPGSPRVMTFAWTLYPRMWAELDLRLEAGAEAVAEVWAEGGEVSWNLHAHPPDAAPAAFVVLAQGSGARVTVRCAPSAPGLYSYLFTNDRGERPLRVRIELRLSGNARLDAIKP
jgi:hypothetical protein